MVSPGRYGPLWSQLDANCFPVMSDHMSEVGSALELWRETLMRNRVQGDSSGR